MIEREKTHTIEIYREDDGDIPAKTQYRADLYVGRDENHHAIGETPQAALLELAAYWSKLSKTEAEKVTAHVFFGEWRDKLSAAIRRYPSSTRNMDLMKWEAGTLAFEATLNAMKNSANSRVQMSPVEIEKRKQRGAATYSYHGIPIVLVEDMPANQVWLRDTLGERAGTLHIT